MTLSRCSEDPVAVSPAGFGFDAGVEKSCLLEELEDVLVDGFPKGLFSLI
jgi:hypothetical protein